MKIILLILIFRVVSFLTLITYKQGAENIAGYISCIRNNPPTNENITCEYVHFVANNSVHHSMSINEIRIASGSGSEIQEMRKALTSGQLVLITKI